VKVSDEILTDQRPRRRGSEIRVADLLNKGPSVVHPYTRSEGGHRLFLAGWRRSASARFENGMLSDYGRGWGYVQSQVFLAKMAELGRLQKTAPETLTPEVLSKRHWAYGAQVHAAVTVSRAGGHPHVIEEDEDRSAMTFSAPAQVSGVAI